MVDLTQTGRIFNITATWAGGKDISQGWSMKITTSNSGGGGTIIPGITELFQMNGEQYGFTDDYAEVPENYYWYGGKNMEVYNAFTDAIKLLNIKYNGYNSIMIDDNIIYTENGVQGSTNPKTETGEIPATTLMPPTLGTVIKVVAKSDGWIYIPAKLSTNKAYAVFEDGMAIGYKYALESTDDRANAGVIAGYYGNSAQNYQENIVNLGIVKGFNADSQMGRLTGTIINMFDILK